MRGNEGEKRESEEEGRKKRTLSNTPKVLPPLHSPPIRRRNLVRRTDDREGHGSSEELGVFGGGFVVRLDGRGVDANPLGGDDGADLYVQATRPSVVAPR
jgi:hypothetical protein